METMVCRKSVTRLVSLDAERLAARAAQPLDHPVRAFTLIELLVVMAVIALLLSILLPALQVARAVSKRTLCTNNCRQTGIGMLLYAEANDGRLIPMTNPSGKPMAFAAMEPWMSVLAYGPNAKIGDQLKPLHLAVLYEQGQIQDPKVFYCPSQPRVTIYPFPFYYEFYTGDGSYPWGTVLPSIPGVAEHTYVRTSYNYWTHGHQRLDEIPHKPVLVDNLQTWEVVPHRRGNSEPAGLGALFGDGHARFCVGADLFDKTVWPQTTAWDQGPGDNRQAFDEILRRLEVNHQ